MLICGVPDSSNKQYAVWTFPYESDVELTKIRIVTTTCFPKRDVNRLARNSQIK
jgi:hypothetical protein